MTVWESNAIFVQDEFDAEVDYEECFYICPLCGEPVYESDWTNEELLKYLCPICRGCE